MGATWSVGRRGGSQSAHDVLVISAGTIAGSGRPARPPPSRRFRMGPPRPGGSSWAGTRRGPFSRIALATAASTTCHIRFGFLRGVDQPTPPAFSTSPLPVGGPGSPIHDDESLSVPSGAPPPLDSRRWARAYQLTQAYGDPNSTIRTSDQGEIAIFWTEHAVRQWNRNIRREAARLDLGALAAARLLASPTPRWLMRLSDAGTRSITTVSGGRSRPSSRVTPTGGADTQGDPAGCHFRPRPIIRSIRQRTPASRQQCRLPCATFFAATRQCSQWTRLSAV